MTKWILAAGAAALAIASPVLAERDGRDSRHGGGKGSERAAQVDRGVGGARVAKSDRGKDDRRGRSIRMRDSGDRAERGGNDDRRRNGVRVRDRDNDGDNRRRVVVQNRGDDDDRGRGRLRYRDRDDDDDNRRRFAGHDRHDDNDRRRGRLNYRDRDDDDNRRGVGPRYRDRYDGNYDGRYDRHARVVRIDDNDWFDRRYARDYRPRGHGGKLFGLSQVLPANYYGTRVVPTYYRDYNRSNLASFLVDDDDSYYRYGDGYVYRIDRDQDIVAGLIPLFGGGYAMGQPYPLGYSAYNVPNQYRSYYADDDDYYYRYGDGAIYQVNRSNGLIDGVVALLAGDFAVGQQLPMGYDAYNVPYAYRDQYYDTADSWYRYNDGYIYQVDPKTQLIQAVISALV